MLEWTLTVPRELKHHDAGKKITLSFTTVGRMVNVARIKEMQDLYEAPANADDGRSAFIPALGADFYAWVPVKRGDCLDDGERTRLFCKHIAANAEGCKAASLVPVLTDSSIKELKIRKTLAIEFKESTLRENIECVGRFCKGGLYEPGKVTVRNSSFWDITCDDAGTQQMAEVLMVDAAAQPRWDDLVLLAHESSSDASSNAMFVGTKDQNNRFVVMQFAATHLESKTYDELTHAPPNAEAPPQARTKRFHSPRVKRIQPGAETLPSQGCGTYALIVKPPELEQQSELRNKKDSVSLPELESWKSLPDKSGWEYVLQGKPVSDRKDDYALVRLKNTNLDIMHWDSLAKKWLPAQAVLSLPENKRLVCLEETCFATLETTSEHTLCKCGKRKPTRLRDIVLSVVDKDQESVVPVHQEASVQAPRGAEEATQNIVRNFASKSQQVTQDILRSLTDIKHKKDIGMLRYEKALDMSIETTRENKTRFPITLFGFVITTSLLVGWLSMAAAPLLQQFDMMAGPLANGVCKFVVQSDAVKKAYAFLEQDEASVINSTVDDMPSDYKSKFTLVKLLDEAVCIPIAKAAEAAAKRAVAKVQLHVNRSSAVSRVQSGSNVNGDRQLHGRRLGEMPALTPLLEAWWEEHPGDPAAKLSVVFSEVADLRHRAKQLLEQRPAEVLAAHRQLGWNAAVEVLLQESKWTLSQEDAVATGELDRVSDEVPESSMTAREEMAQMRAQVQDLASELREARADIKRLMERWDGNGVGRNVEL